MAHSYPPAETIDDFKALADRYAKTIEELAAENSRLKSENNNLRQKLESARKRKEQGDGN